MTLSEVFESLRHESDVFRSGVASIIETEKDEDNVTEQEIVRGEFCLKLENLKNTLSDKMDELDGMKRQCNQMLREQRSDMKKLEKLKWYLVRLRKHGA